MKKYFDDPVKQEMLEKFVDFLKMSDCPGDMFVNKQDSIYLDSKDIIEKATGKPIEEVIK